MDQTEQLRRYLDDEMDEAERLAFELSLSENPELKERLELHRAIDASLGNRKEIAVEQTLLAIIEAGEEDAFEESELDSDAIGTEEPSETKAPSGKSRRIWTYFAAIGAAAVLFFVVRAYFFSSPGPEQIYLAYYQAYDGANEVRSGDDVPKYLLDNAFDAYIEKNFQKAETSFQVILDTLPNNARARFYLGICQLENGKSSLAASSFEQVIQHGKNLYISQSHWYRGMACLSRKDIECAKSELLLLANGKGIYRDKAIEILDDL